MPKEIRQFTIVKDMSGGEDSCYTTLYDTTSPIAITILEGDDYHDNIDHVIIGFLYGMKSAGVQFEVHEDIFGRDEGVITS